MSIFGFGGDRGKSIIGAAGQAAQAVAARREDSEDLFAHTRMSLGDHIEDLRRHMIKALIGFVLGMIVGFFVAPYIVSWIAKPVEGGLMRMYYKRIDRVADDHAKLEQQLQEMMEARNEARARHNPPLPPIKPEITAQVDTAELRKALGLPAGAEGADETVPLKMKVNPIEMYGVVDSSSGIVRPPRLSSLSVTEVFMVYLKVAMYSGIVIASPWILYQIWMFIAAGLYPHERKYIHIFLPISLGLFLAGVALCELVVLPYGVDYLLGWNEYLGIEAELRLNEWLSFAIMMPVIFGVAFQTPLVMFFLERVGIVDVSFYTRHRRMAIFILALAGGLLSVAPDIGSMLMLGLPMILLYEVGILMCKYMPRRQIDDLDVPQSEELIEV